MKKIIVAAGLFLLVAGFPVSAFPAQEFDTEIVEISNWDLQSRVLTPFGEGQDSAFYGRLMKPEWWFQLNLSSSEPIEVVVSIIQHNPDEKVPIFYAAGTNFSQKVSAHTTGTYVIDVQNRNPSSATLEGHILTEKLKTNYYTVYPYASLGILMILGGISVLFFGMSRKSQKPLKSKRAKNKDQEITRRTSMRCQGQACSHWPGKNQRRVG